MRIQIIKQTLSDGSHAFDLFLGQDGQTIKLPACSERDAFDLITKLADAITTHSVEGVVVS